MISLTLAPPDLLGILALVPQPLIRQPTFLRETRPRTPAILHGDNDRRHDRRQRHSSQDDCAERSPGSRIHGRSLERHFRWHCTSVQRFGPGSGLSGWHGCPGAGTRTGRAGGGTAAGPIPGGSACATRSVPSTGPLIRPGRDLLPIAAVTVLAGELLRARWGQVVPATPAQFFFRAAGKTSWRAGLPGGRARPMRGAGT